MESRSNELVEYIPSGLPGVGRGSYIAMKAPSSWALGLCSWQQRGQLKRSSKDAFDIQY